jgi:hypothetical protein
MGRCAVRRCASACCVMLRGVERVTVNLSERVRVALEARAGEEGRSVSGMAARLLESALAGSATYAPVQQEGGEGTPEDRAGGVVSRVMADR